MAAASGSPRPPLVAADVARRLHAEPWSFEFFQAIRLLHLLYPERRPVGMGTSPAEEVVRFQVVPTVAFPASEILSLRRDPDGDDETPELAWDSETAEERARQLVMAVHFMGLTGPMGTLPVYYTELVANEVQAGNPALRDFLDVFHHRIIALFYRAWEKYRALEQNSGIAARLVDLIGLGTPGLQDRQAVSDRALIFYTGLLSQQTRSASALQNLLMDYFEVPVRVEQFAGAWCRLKGAEQSRLDEGYEETYQLGWGTVLGDEMWEPQARARVVLGPLALEDYLSFLPAGSAHASLRSLLRFFGGDEVDFEVQLVLRRKEAPPCELGASGTSAPRLGYVSWVKSRDLQRDPADAILQL